MTKRRAMLTSASTIAFASAPPADAPNIGSVTPEVAALLRQKRGTVSAAGMEDCMLRRSDAAARMLEYWQDADAMVSGHRAMKLRADRFIPKFADEDQKEYETRKQYTKYTNVFGDIIENLASKPFEQEVTLVGDNQPEQITTFVENVDGANNNLTVFAANTFYNGIKSAIDWIMVDYSEYDPTIRTAADEKRVGVRPYWSHVLALNVLDAQATVIAGSETITYARIFEPGKPDHIREFVRSETGIVSWVVYEKREAWRTLDAEGKERTQFWPEKEGIVTIGIIPLVPFATGRREGRTFFYDPPMQAAADLQATLFRNESAHEWTKNLAAYPMLVGNGVKPPMAADGKTIAKLATGPNRVLYSPPDGEGRSGTWNYIQPDAAILQFNSGDIEKTKQDLRELGRQPLTAQSGNLTVVSSAVAAGKAASAVKAWALALKDALEIAFVYTAMWYSLTNVEPEVSVFTDFDDVIGDGKDVEALNSARGRTVPDISGETWRDEMRRRGILAPEATEEREQERLLAETPSDGEDTLDDNKPDV